MAKLTYKSIQDLAVSLYGEPKEGEDAKNFSEEDAALLNGDYGQEYAFLLELNNVHNEQRQKFLDDFDPALLREVTISISEMSALEQEVTNEQFNKVKNFYSTVLSSSMSEIGERHYDAIDLQLSKRVRGSSVQENEAVLSEVGIDFDKLTALKKLCEDHPVVMTDIHIAGAPKEKQAYEAFFAEKDACKAEMLAAGIVPDFCAGNYSSFRDATYPLYLKKDYYVDSFMVQLKSGLEVLNDMGIDVNNKQSTVGLLGKIYQLRSKYAEQTANAFIDSYPTKEAAYADLVCGKNEDKFFNINGIAKMSEVALNIAYQCREKGPNDAAVTNAYHSQRDKMFLNYGANFNFMDNRLDALLSLKNMSDVSKLFFEFDGKVADLPKANNQEYTRNVTKLTNALVAKIRNTEKFDEFESARNKLTEISQLATQKYSNLSFFHKLFHPIISSQMKKTSVAIDKFVKTDLARESKRRTIQHENQKCNDVNKGKKEFSEKLGADFEKDFGALGYKAIANSFVRKFNVIRMSLVGKLDDATIMRMPDIYLNNEQKAIVDSTIAEVAAKAKEGDKAYFDDMMERTGEYIKNMSVPDFESCTPRDIAVVTGRVNEMARFAIDFTQIQPKGQYEQYAKTHPVADKAEMAIEQLGKLTKDMMMPVGDVKAISQDPSLPFKGSLDEAYSVINAAEAISFLKQNKDAFSGKKLTEIGMDAEALQLAIGQVQTTTSSKVNPKNITEALKVITDEPNTYDAGLKKHYIDTARVMAETRRVAEAQKPKQKLVDKEPHFKDSFTTSKTVGENKTTQVSKPTVGKDGPTMGE